jgi:PAS domain S-box-containing protein
MGEILGADPEQFVDRPLLDVIHPDDRDLVRGQWLRRKEGEPGEYEARLRRPDGRDVWVLLSSTPQWDGSGAYSGALAMLNDVTSEKVTERLLEDSERRYRQIIETANEGVWAVDPEGRTTFASKGMAALLGLTPDEMVGRHIDDFVLDPEAARRRLDCRARNREQFESVLLHRDGSHVHVLNSASAQYDGDGNYTGALAMVVDISRRVRAERVTLELEAQLHRMQKLGTIGQLAGGIAHDFNNLLAVILNYADFALDAVTDGTAREEISEIKRAAERAADLTNQLLLFSRYDSVTTEIVQVNDLLGDLERLMRRTLGEHIRLRVDASAVAPAIRANRSRLEQVLMNLAINARDAMPDGGDLVISTRLVQERGSPWLRVVVRDTGEGMPEEVRHHIFEPFFTTKPKGSGTGLGLATVYGIVSSCGGHIEVTSEPGEGTLFTIHLPAAAGISADKPGGPSAAAPASGSA